MHSDLLDLDRQIEATYSPVKSSDGGNGALEAGIEEGGMKQIILRRDGFRQTNLGQRFPLASPAARDALKQRSVIQTHFPAIRVAFLAR